VLCVYNASEGNAGRGKRNKQKILKIIRERYTFHELLVPKKWHYSLGAY
jgi:hypothetical protein